MSNELIINYIENANLTINCSNHINITAETGATNAIVTWDEPSAISTCSIGETTITQIEGLPNGSLFPIGTTTIVYQALDNCGNQMACSFDIIVAETITSTDYCVSSGTLPWLQWIGGVSFGGINNPSGKTPYSDFTNLSTMVEQGETYPITLHPDFSFTEFEEYWRVWIDFNQDGDFEDSNELVLEQNSIATISEQISIPADALIGTTRMRVSMKNGDFATACETIPEGEVEDYSIIIEERTIPNDTTPPSVVLSTTTQTVYSDFLVTATFSEAITGLSINDFLINNGTISNLNANGNEFMFLVSPITFGEVSIQLPASSVIDAANNQNTTSNSLIINYIQAANLTFNCTNNITLTAETGETTVLVTWNEPSATSSCTIGEVVVEQIEGLPNGSLFPIGSTAITYQANDGCGNQSTCNFDINIQEGAPPAEYCDALGNSPWLEYISNVSFGDIDNTSFKERYGDFTNLSTSIEAGGRYPIRLTPDFSFTVYEEYWTVWIDFNQDSDFDDVGELVLMRNGTETIEDQIDIPNDALLGSTRMRIAMKNGSFAESCESFNLGEVEDYTVVITEGTIVEDTIAPNVVLSTINTNVEGEFEVFITFDEPVFNLSLNDFIINNGVAFGFSGFDSNYSFVVSPDVEGLVSIFLPASIANDSSGNINTASNVLEVNYSTPPPNETCPTIDLLSLEWNPITSNNNLIYNPLNETASYSNSNKQWRGTELLFSDIDFEPNDSSLFEIQITITNYTATNHQLKLYTSDGNDTIPLIGFEVFAGGGTQSLMVSLENQDRFLIAGKGSNNDVSFATVELSQLSINCIEPSLLTPSSQQISSVSNPPSSLYSVHQKMDLDLNIEKTIVVFPNPAVDYFEVSSVFEHSIEEIALFNTQGQLVQQLKSSHHEKIRVPVSTLNKGVYWCKIKTKDGFVVKKVLKM